MRCDGGNGGDRVRLGPVERPEERVEAWCVTARSGECLLRPPASFVRGREALDASRATLHPVRSWSREEGPDGGVHATGAAGPCDHGPSRVPKGATDL